MFCCQQLQDSVIFFCDADSSATADGVSDVASSSGVCWFYPSVVRHASQVVCYQ